MTAVVKAAPRAPRDVWDEVVARAGERMGSLTSQFAAGELSEAEYVLEMRGLVKSLHMGALAVGSGGTDRVTPTMLRRLGPVLRQEYAYIQRKVGRLGTEGVNVDEEVRRVAGYAQRARGTYENATVRASGHTEVRRIVHSGESCSPGDGSPNCEHEAGRGWHSVESFVPIGRCVCGHACKCSVETRTVV